ncbi:MAG TPA: rod shape-determining protein RodA [Chitinophagales bacterium]|nr:rod shape-determining protein RodA [Chitinophagales bacterium]
MSYEGQRRINQGIDWILILLFAVLVLIGWMAIFAATYDESQPDIFDLDKSYGRQFLWITGSTILAGAILITDSKFYATVAYGIYATVVLLLAAVFVIGTSKHGNMNWIEIGSFQLQPSEFSKFATNLALAKFLSGLNVNMKNLQTRFVALGIFGLPALLVLLQGDTGSALVFLSYFLVLFRFGLPGSYLLLGVYVLVLSVLSLLFDKMILILVLFAIAGVLFYIARKNRTVVLIVLTALLLSSGYVLTTDYVFNHVLEKHQQQRVNVLLGKKVDVKDADYNVRQSKIAIGSGGLQGKGFLNGTLTKYNFVPEQSTDFIFCTIGEEFGFWGSALLLLLYLALMLRILFIAQRQRSKFSMIYAYGVAAIIFFHVLINIGMTIGLMPVIGIPLPFISYGGSSLWSFTILLFILVKLDGDRLAILR